MNIIDTRNTWTRHRRRPDHSPSAPTASGNPATVTATLTNQAFPRRPPQVLRPLAPAISLMRSTPTSSFYRGCPSGGHITLVVAKVGKTPRAPGLRDLAGSLQARAPAPVRRPRRDFQERPRRLGVADEVGSIPSPPQHVGRGRSAETHSAMTRSTNPARISRRPGVRSPAVGQKFTMKACL